MRRSRPLLAVLGRLAAYHEVREREACERAGVDRDCTYRGGISVLAWCLCYLSGAACSAGAVT